MRAQIYQLLHAVLASAVTDELIDAKPARIKGADLPKRKHTITVATLAELEAVPLGQGADHFCACPDQAQPGGDLRYRRRRWKSHGIGGRLAQCRYLPIAVPQRTTVRYPVVPLRTIVAPGDAQSGCECTSAHAILT